MIKWMRQYKLTIQTDPLFSGNSLPGSVDPDGNPLPARSIESTDSDSVTIKMPITIRFQVDRSVSSTVNKAWIQIYNLPDSIRQKIFHDYWTPTPYRQCVLQVGYDSLSTIFHGNINRAYSARSGSDIITFIECFDGGYATINTKTSVTLNAANTTDVHKTLINEFPTLTTGVLGLAPEDINRPVVLEGNTWELLRGYTNQQCFIDAEKIYTLAENQVLAASVPLITSANSILGTPQREGEYVSVPVLMEPGIVLGQIVKLQSKVQSQFDGQYKVFGISHNGIISGAVNGECQTILNLVNATKFSKGLVQVN